MPRVYRITHRKYASEPYSGKGGLHAAGRWASKGHLVSYAADSLALAVLEQIGRTGSIERLEELVYTPAEVQTEAITTVEPTDLPDGWDSRPPGQASQDFGDRWLEAKESVALRVPSVMLPEGDNYVLNPAHPDFETRVAVGEARPLGLDPRIVEHVVFQLQ